MAAKAPLGKEPQNFLKDVKGNMKNLVHKIKGKRDKEEAQVQRPAGAGTEQSQTLPVQAAPVAKQAPPSQQQVPQAQHPAQPPALASPEVEQIPLAKPFQYPQESDDRGWASQEFHGSKRERKEARDERLSDTDLPIEERYRRVCDRHNRIEDNTFGDGYSDSSDSEYVYSGPRDYNRLYSDIDCTRSASRSRAPVLQFERPLISSAYEDASVPHSQHFQHAYGSYGEESRARRPEPPYVSPDYSFASALPPPYMPTLDTAHFPPPPAIGMAPSPAMYYPSHMPLVTAVANYPLPSHGLTFLPAPLPADAPLPQPPATTTKAPAGWAMDPSLSTPYNSTWTDFGVPTAPLAGGNPEPRVPFQRGLPIQ